jgi:hypothetical protein
MSPQQLESILSQLDAKGASKEEIQEVYNAYKTQDAPAAPAVQAEPIEQPGFLQSAAQVIAKPFLGIGASAAGGLEGLAYGAAKLVGADSFAERRRQDMEDILNGVDTGYLGIARPLGSDAADGGVKDGRITGQGLAKVFGGALEAGSYFASAPLKGAEGFWQAAKAGKKVAGVMAAGAAANSLGDGKDLGEAAVDGGVAGVGTLATFGLMNKAADVFKIWGAKALQDPIVQASAAKIRDTADHIFNTVPEIFGKGFTSLADITNVSTRRAVNALRSEFNRDYNTAKNAIIDSLVPDVGNPDRVFGKFQRSLSETMGNMFRDSNKLYDKVKADPTLIDDLSFSKGALGRLKMPEIKPVMSAAEIRTYQESMGRMSIPFQGFHETMSQITDRPLTMGQIINANKEALNYIAGSSSEERAAIREFAAGLFRDARTVLEKKNPALVQEWDDAYNAWLKASRLYDSSVLNKIKSVGEADDFVGALLDKKFSPTDMHSKPLREAFLSSLNDGNRGATQELVISSLLRRAKDLSPEDGSKLLRSFLDNWEDGFLTPEQTKMLDSFASFMDGNFDKFVVGMRGELEGLNLSAAQEEALSAIESSSESLIKGQTQLDVMKVVNDGRLDQISQKFAKLKDSPELAQVVSTMSPEEKSIVGLSITKDAYNAEMPVLKRLSDGKYSMDKGFADAILKAVDAVEINKALEGLFTPEQIAEFDKVAKAAESLRTATTEIGGEGLANLLRLFVSAFYFKRGWIPGSLAKISQTMKSVSDQVELNRVLREAIESGMVEKNKMYKLGDILQMIGGHAAGPAGNATGAMLE